MLADNMVREQVNIESPEMWESGMLLLIPVGENVQIWDTEKHTVSVPSTVPSNAIQYNSDAVNSTSN